MRKVDKIFLGAIEVFAEKGFDRATMDEIAEQSGVAKGTLYYHFKSKEELISFLIKKGMNLLIEQVKEKIDNKTDPLLQIKSLIEAQLMFFDQNRNLCQILLKGAWSDNCREKQFRYLLQDYYGLIENILTRAEAMGKIRKSPIDWSSITLFGTTAMLALRFILDEKPMQHREMAEFLFQQFYAGLKV
ncbi:TetR/AcrR family transcriptional regulator [Heliorestis convoluta]|uniref:Putative tetR/acrR family transcriptional regulator n=1 Tax=Heliorestis convoluta TaxID=356322 RepID=A0A5Q2N323_9FIRM|nr:TetR/AcrR family transcriptional regulator [Heliorestis convoluta]QGG46975.1 putative tetR/acrR family transcriptional regulator [Heliorestis convoluta]